MYQNIYCASITPFGVKAIVVLVLLLLPSQFLYSVFFWGLIMIFLLFSHVFSVNVNKIWIYAKLSSGYLDKVVIRGDYPVIINWHWTKNTHIPLSPLTNKMINFVFLILFLQILSIKSQVSNLSSNFCFIIDLGLRLSRHL